MVFYYNPYIVLILLTLNSISSVIKLINQIQDNILIIGELIDLTVSTVYDLKL